MNQNKNSELNLVNIQPPMPVQSLSSEPEPHIKLFLIIGVLIAGTVIGTFVWKFATKSFLDNINPQPLIQNNHMKNFEYTLKKDGKMVSVGKYNILFTEVETSPMRQIPNGPEIFPQNTYHLSVNWKEQVEGSGATEGSNDVVELSASNNTAEVGTLLITLLKENPDGSITISASQVPKILETKTFSCPGMEGFTFEYPVFELKNNTDNAAFVVGTALECTIYFQVLSKNDPNAPQVKIKRIQHADITGPSGYTSLNPIPQTTLYLLEDKEPKILYFYLDDYDISIQTLNVSEDMGFSEDLFFKTIIDSFRLTK